MSFVRVMLLEKEEQEIDKIVARKKMNSMQSTEHKRIFFAIPDISGKPASYKLIAEELHNQLPDSPCVLVKKECKAPVEFNPKAFPFNAAYVRYQDAIVYYNEREVTYIHNRYRVHEEFDETLKTKSLKDNEHYVLSDEDLSNIILKTTHIHERKTPILIYTDPKISEGAYKTHAGFNLVQQEYLDIWTLISQYKVERPFLIAYSYSSVLAIEIMQHVFVKRFNKKIDAVVLDSTTPTVWKNFFANKSNEPGRYSNTLEYVDSLINIVKYCATVSDFTIVEELDIETKEYLQTLGPEKCIEEIAKIFIGDRENYDLFESTSQCAAKRLAHLASFEKEKEIDKPMKDVDLTIILTDETQAKYQHFSPDNVCGWHKFAEKMHIVGYELDKKGNYVRNPKNELEDTLLKATHLSLSQNEEHANLVAATIVNTAKRIDDELKKQKENRIPNTVLPPVSEIIASNGLTIGLSGKQQLPPVSEIIESNRTTNGVVSKRQQANSPDGSPRDSAVRFFQRKKASTLLGAPVSSPRCVSPLKR